MDIYKHVHAHAPHEGVCARVHASMRVYIGRYMPVHEQACMRISMGDSQKPKMLYRNRSELY